jgi:hypothetical protein
MPTGGRLRSDAVIDKDGNDGAAQNPLTACFTCSLRTADLAEDPVRPVFAWIGGWVFRSGQRPCCGVRRAGLVTVCKRSALKRKRFDFFEVLSLPNLPPFYFY